MATKRPRRVSKKQLEFLEYLIWRSKDADDFTKKALILLVRKSRGLTEAVRIRDRAIVCAVSHGLHNMCSCSGTTHIDHVFCVAGSSLIVDYGGAAICKRDDLWKAITALRSTKSEINSIVPADPYKH